MDAAHTVMDHLRGVATGDVELAGQVLHPENVNHMAADEPPACARPGLPGLMATSAWLRLAFTDLTFELIECTADDEKVMAHVWMRERHTGPFVVFPPSASPVAFPPTGRTFAVRHGHVFRVRDSRFAEHIAVRDDLGRMTQLGHLPPPHGIGRMIRLRISGERSRAVRRAVQVAEEAADAAVRTAPVA